jgi:hypothetical protein
VYDRTLRHRDAISFVRNYRAHRGMEFLADVDDWLGGWSPEHTWLAVRRSRRSEPDLDRKCVSRRQQLDVTELLVDGLVRESTDTGGALFVGSLVDADVRHPGAVGRDRQFRLRDRGCACRRHAQCHDRPRHRRQARQRRLSLALCRPQLHAADAARQFWRLSQSEAPSRGAISSSRRSGSPADRATARASHGRSAVRCRGR